VTTDPDPILGPSIDGADPGGPGDPGDPGRRFTRRAALTVLGVAGAGVVAGCGSGPTPSATPSTTAASTGTTAAGSAGTAVTTTAGTAGTTGPGGSAAAVDCVLTPEVTQGPYYLDLDKVRRDITEGRPGRPLELTIVVLDASTCRPIRDAAVDIWHCDAGGIYSGFSSASGAAAGLPGGPAGTVPGRPGRPAGSAPGSGRGGPGVPPPPGGAPGGAPGGGETGDASANTTDNLIFLRGTQISDAEGKVTFDTIYPGWYQGRAVHIHMKVHVRDKDVHTGQFFFDDATSDEVFAAAPYATKGKADMRNADDSIYRGAGGATAVLALTPRGTGYASTIAVGVKPA